MERIGRTNEQTREIKFTKDFTKHALGSVLVEFGDTRVITTASVEEGKPKWMDKEEKRGWVTAEYSLLPSAPNTRCQRERTKISGRTQEIQRLIGKLHIPDRKTIAKEPEHLRTQNIGTPQENQHRRKNPIGISTTFRNLIV